MKQMIIAIGMIAIALTCMADNTTDSFNEAFAQSFGKDCDKAVATAELLIKENIGNMRYYEIIYNCIGKTSADVEKYLLSLTAEQTNAAGPHYALGRYYIEKKDFNNAIRALTIAYELDSTYLYTAYYLAKSYIDAKLTDNGLAYFNGLDSSIWTKEIGITAILLEQKKNTEPIQRLEALFTQHSDSWELVHFIRFYYYMSRDDQRARDWSMKEVEIATRNNNNEQLAESLEDVAAHSINIGDNPTAMEYSLKAAHKYEELGNLFYAAEWYKDAGMCYASAGKIHQALQFYKKAAEIADTYSFAIQQCYITNSIGFLYLNYLGETEKAIQILKNGAEFCSQAKRKHTGLQGLSSAYLRLNDFNEAKHYLDKTKELLGSSPSPYQKMSLLQHECNYYMAVKEWSLAEIKCKDLLTLPETSIEYSLTTNFINAKLYYQWGKYARSEEFARKSMQLADSIDELSYQWLTRLVLADSYRDQDKIDEAIKLYQEAIHYIEQARSEISSTQYRTFFFKTVDDVYNSYILALWRKHQAPGNNTPSGQDSLSANTSLIEQAFILAEKAKSRTLLDLLSSEADSSSREEPPEIRKEFSTITMLQSQIRNMANSKKQPAELAKLKDELHQSYDRYRLLKETTKDHTNEIAAVPVNLTLSEIQQALPENTALLEYKIMATTGFCFLVTKTGIQWMQIPGNADSSKTITSFVEHLSAPSRLTQGALYKEAHELFNAFLKEPQKQLSNTIKFLIIVPDTILHNVPFEALLQTAPSSAGNLDFVIKQYEVAYAPSAHVFSLLASRGQPIKEPGTKQTLLAVADPRYKGEYLNKIRSSYELEQPLGKLKFSRTEIQNIKQIPLFSMALLADDSATETHLKRALATEYKYLHFAVHGILNSREPGLSGLVLLPGSEKEDGILQLFEIEQLRTKAELVFLSACNSASGKIYSGEGIIGLSTAFIQAGASRVIGTMWTIDDYSTSILVKDFYHNLLKNEFNYADALRNAQLFLLQQARYQHPYYWASFRLIL